MIYIIEGVDNCPLTSNYYLPGTNILSKPINYNTTTKYDIITIEESKPKYEWVCKKRKKKTCILDLLF